MYTRFLFSFFCPHVENIFVRIEVHWAFVSDSEGIVLHVYIEKTICLSRPLYPSFFTAFLNG